MAPTAGTTGSGPAAFASIMGAGGKSTVYFVDKEGTIQAWQQRRLVPESMYLDPPKNPKNDKEALLAKDKNLWNRRNYDLPEVSTQESKVIKTASGDLSVVTLTEGGAASGQYQVRLYYASDKKDTGGVSILSELCLDLDPADGYKPTGKFSNAEGAGPDGYWYKGQLDEAKIEVKEGSSISAHVQLGKTPAASAVKVYYWPANPKPSKDGYGAEDRPAIAWITLDYKYGWLSTESGI
ncbi:hypothetical protein CKM354_000894300 [Cercospora kikuchii]|uniref:Uncharacterized protein n=1 Tax=Cercospora kikuchii TaxID=84275 RepID=A0A9P3CNC7_9PEZI|nr:uncharacterized protein CKM354_000894300 [Cercospora kikuchii]GIZ45791.1 hypothetical protein CKM354_000894300 [Cercospora kikuchii]